MKRTQTIATGALGVIAAGTLALTTPQDQSAELEALRAKVGELEESVEYLTAWTEAQAKAADGLIDALGRSEKEGFTAGINPRSREILLAGLRATAEATKSVDADDKEDEKKTPASRRGRRRGK